MTNEKDRTIELYHQLQKLRARRRKLYKMLKRNRKKEIEVMEQLVQVCTHLDEQGAEAAWIDEETGVKTCYMCGHYF